jgi:hypothetical protein
MKKDQAPKPAKGIPKKMNEGEAADPRKALFAAIQRRGANDDDSSAKPPPADPRQALFAAIKNKGADASTTTAPGSNIKYSRGMKRLESFIWKAEASLSLTERDQGAALRACKVSSDFYHTHEQVTWAFLTLTIYLFFPPLRVLRCTVERKVERDLPRCCCKFYPPLLLRLKRQSRSMTRDQSSQSGKRHRTKVFHKQRIRKIK